MADGLRRVTLVQHNFVTAKIWHIVKTFGLLKLYTFIISVACFRVVEAGLAGPAAAGPIFGQLTHAKMLYELRQVVQLFLSKQLR